jgi:hypothetical protein
MPPETLVSLALLAAVAAAILLSSRRQSARPLALIAATAEGGWRIHHGPDTVDAYRANADLLAALPGIAKTHRIILTDPAHTRLSALPLTPTERRLLDLP